MFSVYIIVCVNSLPTCLHAHLSVNFFKLIYFLSIKAILIFKLNDCTSKYQNFIKNCLHLANGDYCVSQTALLSKLAYHRLQYASSIKLWLSDIVDSDNKTEIPRLSTRYYIIPLPHQYFSTTFTLGHSYTDDFLSH